MAAWKCDTAENLKGLTVGSPFILRCQGELPETLKEQQLKIVAPQPDDYRLHLLEFKGFREGQGELLVTSYETGQHQLNSHRISDGTTSIELEISPFVVESVLTPGVKAEPFGPFGPLVLPWPHSIWYFLAALGLMLLGLIGLLVRLMRARRDFLNQLQSFRTPLAPCHQFQKEVRSVLREAHFKPQPKGSLENLKTSEFSPLIEKIEHHLRVYLTLKFVVPAYNMKIGKLFKKIRVKLTEKGGNPLHWNSVAPKLRLVFGELSRCRKLSEISRSDFEQLVHLTQEAVNAIEYVPGGRT